MAVLHCSPFLNLLKITFTSASNRSRYTCGYLFSFLKNHLYASRGTAFSNVPYIISMNEYRLDLRMLIKIAMVYDLILVCCLYANGGHEWSVEYHLFQSQTKDELYENDIHHTFFRLNLNII